MGIGADMKTLSSYFAEFLRNTAGNFAMTLALGVMAIMVAAGSALDYSTMSENRTKFQNVLDSAALAAAIALKKQQWSDAEVVGLDHFNGQVLPQLQNEVQSLQFDYVDDTVRATLMGRSDNTFMKLAGVPYLDYKVEAAVRFPDFPIEVAMVLDTTFSMSVGGKINTLKSAAREFVDTILETGGVAGDRKISIVPFAKYVNVGRDKMGSNWLDAEDEEITHPEQCTTTSPIISQSDCHTETINHPARQIPETCSPAVYQDGVRISGASCTPARTEPAYTSTRQVCNNIVYGPPETTCQPAWTETIYWNGCVASRRNPRHLNDRDFQFRVPGPNRLVCPSEIIGLTDNKSQLHAAINSITAVGDTYIPQGVVWGMRTLSPHAPYEGGRSMANMNSLNGRKYLVLMTDGINVRSPQIPGSPLHDGTDVNKADQYLERACDNVKDEGIEVFTVSFGSGVDADTRALLENCATAERNYFHADTNTDFKDVFRNIADQIITVHLTL